MAHNILLFTSTFPRWENDPLTPRFVFELARELTRRFNVFVLAPHAPGAAKEETLDRVRVIRFPYCVPESAQTLAYGTGIATRLKTHKLSALQVPPFLAAEFLALRRVVKQHDIHLVNSHWMIPQGFLAALLARPLSFRHVLTIHAADLFALRRLPFGKRIARYLVSRCDAIYCVSSYNHQMLEDLIRRPVSTRILPMGIDTAYYREDAREAARRHLGLDGGPLVLYVGKLNEKKGVGYLIEAFPELLRAVPGVRLAVVGMGHLEDSLKRQAADLGLQSGIRFEGPKNKAEVRHYFQAADVVVVPSIIDAIGETEGTPVVLLEALAAGRPVVATSVGGAPDLVTDGHNGYLAAPRNPADLTQGILRILREGPERFTEAARASVLKYDWQHVGGDYGDTFDALLSP